MDCPKCKAAMREIRLSTLSGPVLVDRCTQCAGMWFDIGEAETLKDKWMADFVDSGDPKVGRQHNQIRDIDCPRCGKKMQQLTDPVQTHILYEACNEHGMYFDAGEFTDYKYETLLDIFRDFIALIRKKS